MCGIISIHTQISRGRWSHALEDHRELLTIFSSIDRDVRLYRRTRTPLFSACRISSLHSFYLHSPPALLFFPVSLITTRKRKNVSAKKRRATIGITRSSLHFRFSLVCAFSLFFYPCSFSQSSEDMRVFEAVHAVHSMEKHRAKERLLRKKERKNDSKEGRRND